MQTVHFIKNAHAIFKAFRDIFDADLISRVVVNKELSTRKPKLKFGIHFTRSITMNDLAQISIDRNFDHITVAMEETPTSVRYLFSNGLTLCCEEILCEPAGTDTPEHTIVTGYIQEKSDELDTKEQFHYTVIITNSAIPVSYDDREVVPALKGWMCIPDLNQVSHLLTVKLLSGEIIYFERSKVVSILVDHAKVLNLSEEDTDSTDFQ